MRKLRSVLTFVAATLWLAGCYTHTASFSAGEDASFPLPDLTLIYKDRGSSRPTVLLLSRGNANYEVVGEDGGIVRFLPIAGHSQRYWAEFMYNPAGENAGKFQSFPVEIKGQVLLQYNSGDTAGVSSRRELLSRIGRSFAAPMADAAAFEIYDLNDPQRGPEGRRLVDAYVAAREAAPKPAPRAEAPKVSANRVWFYTEEQDAISGKLRQYVFGLPNGQSPEDDGPFLRIGCYDRSERHSRGLTIFWKASLFDLYPQDTADATRVTARFGNRQPVQMGFDVSGNFAETYPPSAGTQIGGALTSGILGMFAPGNANAQVQFGWDVAYVHAGLAASDQVVFRGYPRSGQQIDLVFDTAGYREVVRNFRPHCR